MIYLITVQGDDYHHDFNQIVGYVQGTAEQAQEVADRLQQESNARFDHEPFCDNCDYKPTYRVRPVKMLEPL